MDIDYIQRQLAICENKYPLLYEHINKKTYKLKFHNINKHNYTPIDGVNYVYLYLVHKSKVLFRFDSVIGLKNKFTEYLLDFIPEYKNDIGYKSVIEAIIMIYVMYTEKDIRQQNTLYNQNIQTQKIKSIYGTGDLQSLWFSKRKDKTKPNLICLYYNKLLSRYQVKFRNIPEIKGICKTIQKSNINELLSEYSKRYTLTDKQVIYARKQLELAATLNLQLMT